MTNFVHAEIKTGSGAPTVPVLGEQGQRVLALVDEASRPTVQDESLRVLARCQAGLAAGTHSSAQLVVGEVQSGKTLSFTTVMALARDNGYPLVVVVAGTKNNLRDQTEKRLKNDLGVIGNTGLPAWRTWSNPIERTAPEIADLLQPWTDPRVPPEFRQTAIVFVLKNATRLNTLAAMFARVFGDLGARPSKALIIDDEADQASLNLKAAKHEQSSTYSAILGLRQSLPQHVYLMYTATPQAPLLVSIADALSPETVTVLTPGGDYVGGADLFERQDSQFVRKIDEADLETALDPLAPAPPASLVEALAYWTLALVVAHEQGSPRPFTMLVHPSTAREVHSVYDGWIKAILDGWKSALADSSDVAFHDLASAHFELAYNELRTTQTGLPLLADDRSELERMMQQAGWLLRTIQRRVVNSDSESDIPEEDWNQFTGWIVIGGNKLDRGFTVKNLAVTYMPRSPGEGNADTIQQRGRFFGYKRGYLGLLRGWFSAETARAFRSYVEHERAMQHELRELDSAGANLKDWRRKFLLDPELRPTRKQVIQIASATGTIGAGWAFEQAELFDPTLAEGNQPHLDTIRQLLEGGLPEPEDSRPVSFKHLGTTWNYDDVIKLLADWCCTPLERESLDRLLFLVQGVLDTDEIPTPRVQLVGMNGLAGEPRVRTSTDRKRVPRRIDQLFQGAGSGRDPYPGDRFFRDDEAISLQVHLIAPKRKEDDSALAPVPALAVAVPTSWERRVYWELPR